MYLLPPSSCLVGSLGHKLGLELLDEVQEEVVLKAEGLLTHDCLHRHHVLTLEGKQATGRGSEGPKANTMGEKKTPGHCCQCMSTVVKSGRGHGMNQLSVVGQPGSRGRTI